MTRAFFDIPQEKHVLIAGPTASGKSALALEIAARHGGTIVNADAIQVYENWRILTARPPVEDEAQAPHKLYGHIARDFPYSVGHWLRDVETLLKSGERLIIVGGTGLYFSALTEGLAQIPPTPPEIRAQADELIQQNGHECLLADIDATTKSKIDILNPMRVQRAWEVQMATGRGIAAWQAETPAPLLPLKLTLPIIFDVNKDWLNSRIALRFENMLRDGVLGEIRHNWGNWDPTLPSSKAIGAPELMSYLRGEVTLETATTAATVATRQFAKRQRTWFRSRMKEWLAYDPLSSGSV